MANLAENLHLRRVVGGVGEQRDDAGEGAEDAADRHRAQQAHDEVARPHRTSSRRS